MHQNPPLKPALIRLGIAAVLLAVSAGFLYFRQIPPEVRDQLYEVTLIPPTCTDPGYSLYKSRENGATFVDNVVPAPGHSYGDWKILRNGDGLTPETAVHSCSVCGAEEEQVRYPQVGLPLLALEGDVSRIGKKSEVPVQAEFFSGSESFTAHAMLKHQGHETLRYAKKSYTLKLYKDNDREEKYPLTFSHWNPENKYILKANYIDPSQCRNLICANIWADMVASRDSVPVQLQQLSNYGAVDGFPVALYLNREFQGLYTFNLHKDDDLFGMEKGKDQAILIANDASKPEALFREPAVFGEDTPWEVEFCGSSDSQWAKEKLNRLIAFVMESDDETFRTHLPDYLDLDSAIDYLLSIYALGLTNVEENDLILVCYSPNQPFFASLYDMDSAFGLSEDGKSVAEATVFLPSCDQGLWNSGTGSLLFDRLLQNFFPGITRRYAQLRKTTFDPEALCHRVTEYTSAIPTALTTADNAAFPHPNPDIPHTKQITRYISQRISLLDTIFMNGES